MRHKVKVVINKKASEDRYIEVDGKKIKGVTDLIIGCNALSAPQVLLIKKSQNVEHLQPDILEVEGKDLDVSLLVPLEDSMGDVFERFNCFGKIGIKSSIIQEIVPFVTLGIKGIK